MPDLRVLTPREAYGRGNAPADHGGLLASVEVHSETRRRSARVFDVTIVDNWPFSVDNRFGLWISRGKNLHRGCGYLANIFSSQQS